jgi:hypothetical protein
LRVPVVTVDLLDLHNVTAMKIDVERSEPQVLAGARKTIERCKPAIILEVLDDERRKAVRAALPGYVVAYEMDERYWLLMPC